MRFFYSLCGLLRTPIKPLLKSAPARALYPEGGLFISDYIKSPMNYTGGKYKILEHIIPSFPKSINNFVDLFAGGLNVGINVQADTIYANDQIIYLIELYRLFQATPVGSLLTEIKERIAHFNLLSIAQRTPPESGTSDGGECAFFLFPLIDDILRHCVFAPVADSSNKIGLTPKVWFPIYCRQNIGEICSDTPRGC